MVDKAQAELWGGPPYPPRTMVDVQRLFDDDIVEIDSVFYAGEEIVGSVPQNGLMQVRLRRPDQHENTRPPPDLPIAVLTGQSLY
jgi:hypothetical protein